MQDCLGALDCTHIPASVSSIEQMAYTNRHGTQSQNILAVCGHDMRFIYVYARWEGSAHNARVLESAMRMNTDFSFPPQGKNRAVCYLCAMSMDIYIAVKFMTGWYTLFFISK
mgnify:CR=1 FL=1